MLDYSEGRMASSHLNPKMRDGAFAEHLRACLMFLDDYLEIPESRLPRELLPNVTVGREEQERTGERRQIERFRQLITVERLGATDAMARLRAGGLQQERDDERSDA